MSDTGTDDLRSEAEEAEIRTREPNGGESIFAGLRGYNKFITLSSFMSYLVYGGISFTVSIYFVIWREEFETSSGLTSLVGSVQLTIIHFMAPVSGLLTQRLGFRITTMIGGLLTAVGLFATAFATNIYVVIATFSVMTGIGIGTFFVPGLTIVSYIEDGRALVNGIASAGIGTGICVMSYVIPMFIEVYAWRGSMFLMSGFALQVCVFGSLMRQPESYERAKCHHREEKDIESSQKRRTCGFASRCGFDIYKNTCAVLFMVHFMTHCVGISLVFVHVTAFAKTVRTSPEQSLSLAVSLLGFVQIFGRLFSGIVGQSSRVDTFLYYYLCSIGGGLSAILFPLVRTYASLITWSVMFGFLTSPGNALYQVIFLYFLDITELNTAFVHLTVLMGVGMMAGAPLAGWVYDITKDYGNSFHLGGAIIAAGGFLLTWPYVRYRRERSIPQNLELAKRVAAGVSLSMIGSQNLIAAFSDKDLNRRYSPVDGDDMAGDRCS